MRIWTVSLLRSSAHAKKEPEMFADVMAALVESCLRASVVLCAAWATTAAMRRASASTRHFVWMCAIAGSMVASAMSFVGPSWTVPVPSTFISTQGAVVSDASPEAVPSTKVAPRIVVSSETSPPTPSTSLMSAGPTWMDLTLVGLLLWGAGALSVLAFVISGAVGAWWIRRSAAPLKATWVDEAHVLAEAFEISGSIAVVESHVVTMPMVCGVWRPLIVMPQSATQWTDERRRVVVLHELAHIKRRDCLTQALAHVVCAVYWFNPIVWLAARRLRAERERACDDFVLAAGEKGSDYAAHLLDIAQAMRHRRMPALVGLAMARPSQLEGRLLAILDPAIRRSSTIHTRLALLGFVLLVTLPVGAVQLQGSAPPADTAKAAVIFEPAPLAPSISSLPAKPAPTPKAASTPIARAEPSSGRAESSSQAPPETLSNAISERVSAEIDQALGVELGQQIAAALSAQTGVAADPKTIEALIGALGDSDPGVRETVVVTLGRMRDPRIVTALLPLLKDSNADVREQVVFALARTGDSRATAAVSTLIDDASPDVREQVVHLLGQSRNRDAVPMLVKALKDSSADVREQAAFALGQLRDPSAVDPLLEMLKDSSPDVREQTVFALGQIRNGKAVDGLMAALKDSNADVREQAAFALGQLRDPKALPSLTAALRDAVADVREQAAFAIGQISGHE
jgi:beta-lactamase regulating signal transducer with metallopeptidase domain